MKITKIFRIITAALFFGFLTAFALLTLFLPKQDFSEAENRYLADLPSLTAKSWFSGRFGGEISEYISDRFALRTRFIGLRTGIERMSGKTEINGVYFADGAFYGAEEPYDYELIDRSVEAINSLGERLGSRLALMIVPTSAQIYSDRLPDYAPAPEQRMMMRYVYRNVSPDILIADVYDELYAARGDYIYYRTDHHWTQRGAYVAYCALISAYGYDPVPLGKINVEHAGQGFRGSLYSKVLSDYAEPDTVDFYSSGGAEITSVTKLFPDGREEVYDSPIFRENLEKKDKYLSYLGENVPYLEINSDASGGSVLVIKDSYANCFLPLLSKHFSRVAAVDLRYTMHLQDVCDPEDFDRVLILYNAATFATDANVAKIGG